jgi:hypothetical protein
VKPLAIRGALAETQNTGTQNLADIGTKLPDTKVKDIVANRVTESAPRLVSRLKGRGQKRKRENTSPSPPKKAKKKATKAKVAGAQNKRRRRN